MLFFVESSMAFFIPYDVFFPFLIMFFSFIMTFFPIHHDSFSLSGGCFFTYCIMAFCLLYDVKE
jgi:hypothetical protein